MIDWFLGLEMSQLGAVLVGSAALVFLFWDQIKGLFRKLPDVLPDEEPDKDQQDLLDFKALSRLDDRAERLESPALADAVGKCKASFFGG